MEKCRKYAEIWALTAGSIPVPSMKRKPEKHRRNAGFRAFSIPFKIKESPPESPEHKFEERRKRSLLFVIVQNGLKKYKKVEYAGDNALLYSHSNLIKKGVKNMSTTIRAELSPSNKYRISKHRYYELKHFCLQYKDWKQRYAELTADLGMVSTKPDKLPIKHPHITDKTADIAIARVRLEHNIKIVEQTAEEADTAISPYILKAVTEGASFVTLKMLYDIPCEKKMFYDRYRKFFWLLSAEKS